MRRPPSERRAEELELATGKYCVEAIDEPKKLPNGVVLRLLLHAGCQCSNHG